MTFSDGHSRRERLEARIGYHFRDPSLLERALTHPSAVHEVGPASHVDSYQRLEFLGDRVLGLVVADMLMTAFATADEGELHRRHAGLVRKEACAEVGLEIALGEALRLGDGENNAGVRDSSAVLSDACEAVIGAVYLDGGLEPARGLIERYWRPRMARPALPPRDAKSTLQEWAHEQRLQPPVYHVDRTGPDHAPRFSAAVLLGTYEAARGDGASKRDAEQEAARAFLVREGVWRPEGE